MKKIHLIAVFTTAIGLLHGQSIPVEFMIGHQYAMYQHTVSKPLGTDTRWGVVHLANVLGWYNQSSKKVMMQNEFMNQGYLRYSLHKNFTAMVGYFYANVPNLSGSLALQYHLKREKWMLVVSPRVDLKEKGAYEMFGMFEFRPSISGKVNLYTRIQAMTSHGPFHHNRSYQRLRLGIDVKKVQFGLAFNADAYGKTTLVKSNAGVFLRKELN